MDNIFIQAAIIISIISLLISLIRFFKGPHTVDRIIAFDTMTIASIALIVFIAAITPTILYLDVALIYGLLGFLGVVIIARYLEKGF